MFAGLFSRHRSIDSLGKDLVAIEAEKRSVPDSCVGINVDEEGLFTLYLKGERLSPSPGERSFFVHPGPYTMHFAPHPEAPEVGVEITLEVQSADQRLARFLYDWDAEQLSVAALATKARQIGGGNLLLPGLSQQEINAPGGIRACFSNAMQEYGFSCTAFKRIDLSNEVDTAEQLWGELNWQQPEAVSVNKAAADQIAQKPPEEEKAPLELAVGLGALKKAKQPGLPYWRVEALDNKLVSNLARELPYLTKRLAQIRIGCDEKDYFHQLRDWEHSLERIASRIRSLPVLVSAIPVLQLSKSERRLRVAKLKHTVTLLTSLKLLVAELEQNMSAVPIERLQLEVTDVIYELELVIRQRAQGVEDV